MSEELWKKKERKKGKKKKEEHKREIRRREGKLRSVNRRRLEKDVCSEARQEKGENGRISETASRSMPRGPPARFWAKAFTVW